MKKTRLWIFVIAAVFLISVFLCAVIIFKDHGQTVEIIQDGKTVCTLDLSKETDRIMTIENEYGKNVIEITRGRIRMLEADCPDKVCVDMGWLSGSVPIVCLPNKLIIRFTDGGSADVTVG